ncbi:MAG: methanol dehydrogenase large subunit protein, partial [Gammaproteobacteria bacterium]|nr:methanol dehydrogenase large subunit protein [Gammaproteobacteria bacterium]
MKRLIVNLALPLAIQFISLPATVHAAVDNFVPVTDAMLQNPADGDWLMWRRTLNSWGYSPLKQIERGNVKGLALVWSRPMAPGLQEATPLVYNGIMYLPNPNDVIQAIDAASGDLIWEYRRKMPTDLRIPFPSINRNLAIYDNLIFDNSFDDYLYALDARTGKLTWETRVLDYLTAPSQQTSGPIVANGKVVSGRGCELNAGPEPCVITAHDAKTGKELWRFGTIEKPDVAKPTWGKLPYAYRSQVGSWLVPSFDPELNLVLIGTSVTSPAPKFVLGGNDQQHLYHNSTLALNADSGKLTWYYQHVIDHWDLDHTFERILADITVAPDPAAVKWINPKLKPGEKRKVVTGIPGKTGIVYTLDRATGEFLWATPTIYQNVVKDIDGATGAVTVNPDTVFNKVGDKRRVCPNSGGGKNWPAGAYNPVSTIMFYPMQNTCMDVTAITDDPRTTEIYGVLMEHMLAPGTDKVGSIYAISAETGKVQWKFEQRAATTSLVATAGGLLFGGDINGRFRAYDQETGKILWETNLGSQVTGYPVSFAVKGRQY